MWGVGSRLPVNGYKKAWNLTFANKRLYNMSANR